MNRNQAKEFYPILQAYAEGRVIECRTKPSAIEDENVTNEWAEIKVIEFNDNKEYRIKPNLEPGSEYRPFKDAEECWLVMQKHQPFGWMKFKYTKCGYYMLTNVSAGVGVGINDSLFSYERIFNDYTFADGTPFGVKVEE